MKCPKCDERNHHIEDCFEGLEKSLKIIVMEREGYIDNPALIKFIVDNHEYYGCPYCTTIYDKDLKITKKNLVI
jgi:hypothetical protein